MSDLQQLRKQIDEVDSKILELIAQRLVIVQKVGEYKRTNGNSIVDPEREQEKINTLAREAEQYGIPRDIIEKVWRTFFDVAYTIEEEK